MQSHILKYFRTITSLKFAEFAVKKRRGERELREFSRMCFFEICGICGICGRKKEGVEERG